jgi:hypothetical protein
MKKALKFILVMVLHFCFLSCNTSIRGTSLPSEITKEIEGEYAFTYNTGQIEVLKMNLDSSYSKVVYPDTTSYKEKKDTLVYNKGIWRVEGKELDFDNWLWCNDHANKNNFIKEPYSTSVSDISWYESDENEPAAIELFDEPYYRFIKVSATNLK